MKTSDKDWGRIYPNIITWITGGNVTDKDGNTGKDYSSYHMLTWVRFWREGKEYQLPVRMDADGVATLEEGSKYDERFHKRCLDIIRFGKPTGDYNEPIKFHDDHVITVTYEGMDNIGEEDGDNQEEEQQPDRLED